MALFKIKDSNVTKLSTIESGKEKNVQALILNVNFLASEYSTSFGGRVDTLGIDKNGSPVIIEYKRNKDDNVINQGLSYLKWLLDHKADFEILSRNKKIDIKIDWTSPRVICVAESYNKFDLDTVEILQIKIELLRYRIYEDDILLVESESQKTVKISTTKIFDKGKKEKETEIKLQKDYPIDYHLEKANPNIKEIFFKLRELILSLDSEIKELPKKVYIAYKLTTNIVDIVIQKNTIKTFLNVPSGKLSDPFGISKDLTKPKVRGHWGNGDYEVLVNNKEELSKLFDLIKQSYNYNK